MQNDYKTKVYTKYISSSAFTAFRFFITSQTCWCIVRRCTRPTPSPTAVRPVKSASPTRPTCRSTRVFTRGSSRTSARCASAASRSYATSSSTSARTQARSPTSALSLAASSASLRAPIYQLMSGPIARPRSQRNLKSGEGGQGQREREGALSSLNSNEKS